MAHSYAHLFALPTTGLRFFTVYGPWGRPDMSLFLFTRKILAGEPIEVFNYGHHARDFTYVDDVGRRGRAHVRQDRRARSRMEPRGARPGNLVGAVPGLQYRQPQPRGAARLYRRHREGVGEEGKARTAAAAARRRGGDLCQRRGFERGDRAFSPPPPCKRVSSASSPGIATITRCDAPCLKRAQIAGFQSIDKAGRGRHDRPGITFFSASQHRGGTKPNSQQISQPSSATPRRTRRRRKRSPRRWRSGG